MFNFEQSQSEKFKKTASTKTRKSVSYNLHNSIDIEDNIKATDKRLAARTEKVGRQSKHVAMLILQGSMDRLQAVPYDPSKFESQTDQGAYTEGFYEHGNRELIGKISQLSNEQLQKIGENDYISKVDLNTIHNDIKNNQYYTQGYMLASIFNEQKGKGRK